MRNRELEDSLETLKSQYEKAEESLKDIQRSFAKIKAERDDLNGILSL